MGVPKFYRWVSERYPCLSETVKEFQIPEFDNLYLDMNGIIHVCSHPEDDNPHFRITEEKIFTDIMHYLEFLFRMIKPRKVFFMAVDGVAPRAKMNQQRGRRFRSAREAEDLERKARQKGETLPTEKRFDSNCITPGTPFMVRLQEALKYFVVQKQSTDPLWQGVRVYLSGHETPGEGEHKIMDFIRAERIRPDYDPNTRHCLNGLDADLMMLGLATHEPHFSLLREEVRFGGRKDQKNKRPCTPEETTFHLLHLSLFREYLDFEFSALKSSQTTFEYDLERIIDDWVLMGFLVGNDFIPHLPNLHINHDALPLLWQTYIEVLPSCGGYLHEGGKLNLERFEKYLVKLSEFDFDEFSKIAGDLKWLEGKKGNSAVEKEEMLQAARKMKGNMKKMEKRLKANQFDALNDLGDDLEDLVGTGAQMIDSPEEISEEEEEEEILSDDDTLDDEFKHHKRNYYMEKLDYEKVTPEVLQDQAECYVRGIQWILLYYYQGVPSWSWFYPHHYAPYMSDVVNFKNMTIEYDFAAPFLPFEQLMAVLPAASKEFLPQAFQSLMTMATSPVIDFYPLNFDTDLNGKQQDWEAVVLIPFIDENRLLTAMRTAEDQMTKEEKSRNWHGPHCLYEYTAEAGPTYTSCNQGHFPDIAFNHSKLTLVPKDTFWISPERLKLWLLPGALLDVYFPGFPTLKHIGHTYKLSKEGVKVFQQNSRGFNVILHITEQDDPIVDVVQKEYLGKEIYVGWPHLYEAKVVSVSDGDTCYTYTEPPPAKGGKSSAVPAKIKTENCSDNDSNIWMRECSTIADKYRDRLGVKIGDTSILLKALPMTGRKYIFTSHGRVTMEKQFGNLPVSFALQTTVKDIAVHDSGFCQFKRLDEYLPVGSAVFMLGWPHYGCQGEILDVDLESGRARINLTIFEEPQLDSIIHNQKLHCERYFPGYVLSQRLGISPNLLSRMTGTVFAMAGEAELAREQQNPHKVNIGLNLKFTKRGEEMPGYTKNVEGQWQYSEKTADVIRDYMMKFPEMFEVISKMTESRKNDNYYESEIIPKECDYNLKAVEEFLKTLPCYSIKTMKFGADIISEGVINALQKETNRVLEINKKRQKRVKMQVKPHLLFRHVSTSGAVIPDSTTTYKTFDRIVNIRQGYAVPFGLRGTVVGIHPAEVEVNTMYEVIFDEEFQGGIAIRGSPNRGYRMPPSALLNLTHGERKNGVRPPHVVETQTSNQQSQQARNDYNQPGQSRGGFGNNQGFHSNRGGNSGYQNNRGGYQDFQPNIGRGSNSRDTNSQRGWERGQAVSTNQQSDDYHPTMGRGNHSRDTNSQRGWERGQTISTNQHSDNKQIKDGYSRLVARHNDGRSQNRNSQSSPDSQEESTSQVFNGASASTSHPKFVTPKVSTNIPTARRLSQEKQGAAATGKQDQVANLEFENMWKQLQTKLPPDGVSETDKGTSLSQAAAVLPRTPSSDLKIDPNSNNSNNNQSSTKIDVQSLFSSASKAGAESGNDGVQSVANSGNKNESQSNPSADKKSKHTGSGKSKVVSNNEFAAMFKSLEEVQISQEGTEDDNDEAETVPEDGSSIIKKILHIDGQSEAADKTEPSSGGNKNYGRQLSIQELFDGVKQQQNTNAVETSPPQHQQQHQQQQQHKGKQKTAVSQGQHPGQGQQPSPQQQGYQQQQQMYAANQKRPALLIPPSQGGNRNPVMELMSFCQSLQMGLPMYDYIPKGGMHYCVVTLITGARFQGSFCKTKDEAAESAASVALLQMKGSMQQLGTLPMMPGYMPGVLPQGRQFSSPNSAFSPVNTFTGNFSNQSQGQRAHYQGHNQRSYNNRGQGQQQQYNQGYRQQNQQNFSQAPNYHNQPGLTNQSVGYGQMTQNPANQGRHDTSSANHKPGKVELSNQEVKNKPTSVVTPFVPLQVVKKQTPQKTRKESVTEDSPTKPTDNSAKGNNSDIIQEKGVDSSKTNMDISANKGSEPPREQKTSLGNSNKGSPPKFGVKSIGKTDTVNVTPDSSDKKTPPKSSAKKPKRRLAANFNFGPT